MSKNKIHIDQFFNQKLKDYGEKPASNTFDKVMSKVANNWYQQLFQFVLSYKWILLSLLIIVSTGTSLLISSVQREELKSENLPIASKPESLENMQEKSNVVVAENEDSLRVVSANLISTPKNGKVVYDSELHRFYYDPNPEFFGLDSFKFQKIYSDGSVSSPILMELYIEPQITLEAGFSVVYLNENKIRFNYTGRFKSQDVNYKQPEEYVWQIDGDEKHRGPSFTFQFDPETEHLVCVNAKAREVKDEFCSNVSSLTKEELQSRKGKSNQRLEINLGKAQSAGKPLNFNHQPVLLDADVRYITKQKVYIRVSLSSESGEEVTSYNGIEGFGSVQEELQKKKNKI